MEFLLYLSPQGQQIVRDMISAKFHIQENVGLCQNNQVFGYTDIPRKFVVCTKNIKNSGYGTEFYINETVYHEATHVAHLCNGYKPFGISKKDMILPAFKYQDIKNSVKTSGASAQIEHEAYWMEDKPNKVKYALHKYCF